MPKPGEFFRGVDDRREDQHEQTKRNYQLKVLLKYFQPLLLGIDLRRLRDDPNIVDLVVEAARLSGARFMNSVRAELLRSDEEELLGSFFRSPLWKRYADLLLEQARVDLPHDPELALVFPLRGWSDWVVHNMGQTPDPAKGEPRVVYPGDQGKDITIQSVKSFTKERIKS